MASVGHYSIPRTMRRRLAAIGVFVAWTTGAAGQGGESRVPSAAIESGKETYLFHCAACHGRTGKGDGPVLSTLKIVPPDLTTLAKRRGGRFSEAEITAFIVGRRPAAHGSSDMPVWGPLFRELNPYDSRIDVRLLGLVDHLKSIQVK